MATEVTEALTELRRLQEQHRQYAAKLDRLLMRPYLTTEERLEEVRLKKLKLLTKDEMAQMRDAHSA